MSSTARERASDDTPAARARFHDPENFFAFEWPAVPRHQFIAERDAAFDADMASGEVLLDVSEVLGTPYPATTPLLLARYLRIRPGEGLEVRRQASAEVHYVMRGSGSSMQGGEIVEWATGDTFCFPGGETVAHRADEDTVVFSVCNEPLLCYESLQPSGDGHARVQPVLWTKADVDRHFEAVFARPDTEMTAGRAVQLGTAMMAPACHPVPSMNVAFNTLEPGCDQRPHRHNGVAITLAIVGDGVYSMIEDEKVPWSNGAAQITPATELHSHHNRGTARMESLVFQDEALHFYTRTPGFSWT